MRKIKDEEIAMWLNNSTFIDYFDRLELIATSLFVWDGLNDLGGDSDFLEQTLFNNGKAVFVKDKTLGYLTLECQETNIKNVYYKPTEITATGNNYNKRFKISDNNAVIIRNNILEKPTRPTIYLYATRLYETERTIDVNLSAQKTPILLEGNSKAMLTLKQIYQKFTGNMPVIFGRKDFNVNDKVNAIKTDAPYLVDKLEVHKHNLWNECLTFLGINNANTDKKERLITDEVEANDDLIKFYLNCFYKPRKEACDEINKKFFNGEEKVKIKINADVLKLINDENNDIMNIENDIEETGENNE